MTSNSGKTCTMLRFLVRSRPAWVVENFVTPAVRSQPFHATAPAASMGFKNFKNSPRLDWKTQKELDKKNADIKAKSSPYVTYAEALKLHRPRAWAGARKKVAWSRLFGVGNSNTSPRQRSGWK